jgi:thymidylate synthase (FAD)
MKVKLIAHTPNPEKLCGSAASVAYSEDGFEANYDKDDGSAEKILNHCVKSGHHSITEHATFTFSIEGISRACSHQLVRHRLASYTQQSQRYVKFDELPFVIPPKIEGNPEHKKLFDETMEQLSENYKKLLDAGVPAEDARYIYPNAAKTNFAVTMNARELMHFFSLRCCERAQWEIRQLADEMLKEVLKVSSVLFSKSGPNCYSKGFCTEGKFTCGRIEAIKKKYEEIHG